jgi:type VI protein secretion system component Hcp
MALDVYLQIEGIKGESADSDGQQTGVWWNHDGYDRAATARLIALFRSHPSVKKILFNDPEIHGVMPWRHHDDHFHVSIRAS